VQDEIHNALKLCIEPDEVKRVFGGGYESHEDIGLFKELKRANELLERSLTDSKQPIHLTINEKDVTVNTPEVKTDVHVPEQPAPVVNVTNEVNPTPIEVKAAEIQTPIVNVTNQVNPTPVNIENNVTAEPQVIIKKKPSQVIVSRDSNGKIISLRETNGE
jgi:aspartyl/asparaginyl-tRNA synthetase